MGDAATFDETIFIQGKPKLRSTLLLVVIGLPAVIELKDEFGSRVSGTATLYDVSSKGASFHSSVLLKPKQKIQARIHSPGDDHVLGK